MTIRLIALWLLALAGLAGTPSGGWTAADAQAANVQDVTGSPAFAPRAERGADRLRVETSILASDEAGGTGDGSATALVAAGLSIQRSARNSPTFAPPGLASGLSAGHAFSARAPPSV